VCEAGPSGACGEDAAVNYGCDAAAVLPLDGEGGGPAIVLLHAGIADRSMWSEHVAAVAAGGHRVVAVDLPGFGDAAASGAAPWLEVLATTDGLGIDRAVLVGNSFGGAVALRVAALASRRVRALLLAQAMPHACHTLIAGAGHLAPLETPDAFRTLLLELLAGLDD